MGMEGLRLACWPLLGVPISPCSPPKKTIMDSDGEDTSAKPTATLGGGGFLLSLRCGHGEDSSDGVKFRRPRGHTFHFPPVL